MFEITDPRSNSSQKSVGQLQLDIAVLQEQKTMLLSQIEETKEDSRRRQDAAATVIAQHKDHISQQEADHTRVMQTIRERADTAERNLGTATRATEELRAELDQKLSETADPSIAQKDQEICDLQAQLREQENVNHVTKERANTISARYKVGDLVRIMFHFNSISGIRFKRLN